MDARYRHRWGRPAALAVAGLLVLVGATPVAAPAPAAAQVAGQGSWETTAPLSVPRYDHTTTLMEDGRVLAVAGRRIVPDEPVTLLRSAEIYNARTEVWGPGGNLQDARWSHTATLLGDGRVLVAGGFGDPYLSGSNAQPVLDSVEIYDPSSRTWTTAASMGTRRALHSAILVPDGRVMVAGGRTCDQPPPAACNFTFRTDSVEFYDPATDTWTPGAPLAVARHTTSPALLASGEVLIPAGFTPFGSGNNADRYDPATATTTLTGNLNVARARQGAMVLDDGRVLVAAGFGGENTSEIYDPATDTWTLTGNVAAARRFNFFFTVLPDGRALIAGGQVPGEGVTTSAELYDPASGEWSPAASMTEAHGSGSSLSFTQEAVLLSSSPTAFEARPQACGDNCGKVLVAGNSVTGSVELYTPGPIDTAGPLVEIDDTVPAGGTEAQVGTSIRCPEGQQYLVEVELTQGESTAAGSARGTCTGTVQDLDVAVRTNGATLANGPGEACVTLRSAPPRARSTGEPTEVCEPVTIVVRSS
ncbi:MAG TPA: kelch repeat-containing protein [Acidimicrobiales bacterium]|nr:kelch repeat-containing protein [Acidimicrobiales bacterium]